MTSGIYKITHVTTGDAYIGSSRHIQKRWQDHRYLLERGKHHNRLLQRRWDECGAEAFTFEILEELQGPHHTFWYNNPLIIAEWEATKAYAKQHGSMAFCTTQSRSARERVAEIVADEGMTAAEIAELLPASKNAVRDVIRHLAIEGQILVNDRRKVVYPVGTLERVRQWLIAHP